MTRRNHRSRHRTGLDPAAFPRLLRHLERTRLTAVALIVLLPACGQRQTMVPVTGKVLYKAQPLEYGSVMFQPTAGGEPARGQIQPDGTFQLSTHKAGDGVQVGTSRVRVTAFEAQRPGQSRSGAQELPLGRSAIPRKYQSFGTSGLTVEVSPDMKLPVVLELD